MTDIYEWYYTQDQDSWELAPSDNRWDTIREGLSYYGGESFYICRASKNEFPFDRLFDVDDMEYRLIDDGCEIWGEDQDAIFRKALTRDQKNELEAALTTTFKDWCVRNNVDLEQPWAFADMQDIETVVTGNYCWVWTQYCARLFRWVLPND